MKNGSRWPRRGVSLLVAVSISAVVACSSTPDVVDEEEEVQLTVYEQAELETGMSAETLEMFDQAATLLKEGDLPEASEILAEVVEREPYFAEAHYNLGLVYGEMDRADEAVAHIERARDLDPGVFDYTVAMAKAYAEAGEYADARRLFEEVVSRQPDNLTAINNLAVISLREGDEQRALEYVEEILREDNLNVGALNTLGLIYMERENISLAQFVLNRALSQDEENANVLNNLGLVYLSDGDIPAAVSHFQRAVDVDPNYLEGRMNLGAILIEYLDYERANEHFGHAVRLAPENCVANLGKGATSFARREHEAAVERFEYYLEHCDPSHLSSHERLIALNQHHLRDYPEAIRYYEKILDLVDDPDTVEQYHAEIQYLEMQMEQEEQVQVEESAEEDSADEDAEE